MRHLQPVVATLATVALTAVLAVALPASVAPPARADIACSYVASAVANFPISDDSTTTSIADLSFATTNDPLVDVDVVLELTHSFVSDLVVTLSYRGETVTLVKRRGGEGDNFTGTRFDDGSATPVKDGAAPFAGRYRPEQTLNTFEGLDPSGTWTLRVTDTETGEEGVLQSWGLVLRTQWCEDVDRDGVKDFADLCPAAKGVLPHGCPVRDRTVTVAYRSTPKEFRGKLTCSVAPRCHRGQPVRIYKVQSGKDAVVGRGLTTATGTYAIPRSGVSGRYYAVAPAVVEEGVAACSRAQSPNLAL